MARILIVEDEAVLALDLSLQLADAGFDVVGPASSSEEALKLLHSVGCDAALLDINLEGETSEPAAAALLALGVPFVSLTGYSAAERPAIFRHAPMLEKPVRTPALLAALMDKI